MSKEKYNPHKNHRKRLYETINSVGMEKVNDYLALEFILTYIIPRKDTNPIAHNLLDYFGSISAVLDASIEELQNIEGIGEHSAKLLTMFPQIFIKYRISKSKDVRYLKTTQDMINYCAFYLRDKTTEEFYTIFLDSNFKILKAKQISAGSLSMVSFDKTKLLKETVIIKNVKYVIITHCHVDGNPSPSKADKMTTDAIVELMQSISISVLDSIIIANNTAYSFTRNCEFEVEN